MCFFEEVESRKQKAESRKQKAENINMSYENLFQFISDCCVLYGIDESHGLKHSKSCIRWVEKLIAGEQEEISSEETQMAIYSAALHDMCDKKYTNTEEASLRIHTWLIEQGWSQEMANALIKIITTMSYSFLKKNYENGLPRYPDHGKWLRAYHLARHADLLDAYIVGRCFLYTQHIYPDIQVEKCWEIVEELFHVRVFRYVSDGWIFLPLAILYAEDLEVTARLEFMDRECDY